MASAKTGLSEAFGLSNDLDGIDNEKAGLAAAADITSRVVESITVTDGVVVALIRNVDGDSDGKEITLTPKVEAGALEWTGSADAECKKFVPANFR